MLFNNYLRSINGTKLTPLIGVDSTVNFLQFNYTDVFNQLVESLKLKLQMPLTTTGITKIGTNMHVHGHLKIGGYPIMGVDQKRQIAHIDIRNDPKVHKLFIKQNYLHAQSARNIDQDPITRQVLNVINSSSIICTFGTSIGETDGFWWNKIGNWLKHKNGTLIIFDICGVEDDGSGSPLLFLNSAVNLDDRKQEITARLKARAKLSEHWFEVNSDRIIIELNNKKMFNFKLPMKVS